MPDVDLVNCEPLKLAGIRHVGEYTAIGPVFGKLAAWAGPAGLIGPNTRVIGIFHDNPREVEAAKLRSDACITIDREIDFPDGISAIELPGGRYAVVRHVGPYTDLHETYNWIFSEWLPASGATPSGVSYEDYINDPNEVAPDDLITDIYVPVGG